ncbi:hypothetical protein PR202_gb25127 [Eleusine coracana subsp. coracana]|uniref:DUF569 domain-containing protein n=1 Tax=Eleusine coracana subsp. coracana TaxID=191504 RepID=A0AAV5FMR7_ELECO|nr:hypothetical protein PR202_gb25127 [Eleusine coracana subsp. coracana]
MEAFNGVRFVRLRSIERRGRYLAADVDGAGVCLSGQRGVHNAVWAVDPSPGPDGPAVLLRGAYGRYLLATDAQAATGPSHGVTVVQADRDHRSPPPGMRWEAMDRRGSFVLRCGLGRYLRANGRYLRWRTAVTVAGDNGSTMMQWAIEIVPVRLTRPDITEPIFQLTHKNRRRLTERDVSRNIRFVRCENNGDINDAAWRTMEIRSHSTMQLRLTLASSLGRFHGMMTSTICIRAGRFGLFTPLHVDLPIGNNRIDLVVVTHGTPGEEAVKFSLWFLQFACFPVHSD